MSEQYVCPACEFADSQHLAAMEHTDDHTREQWLSVGVDPARFSDDESWRGFFYGVKA